MTASTRAGRYINQPERYKAFVPAPLPPAPPLVFDEALSRLLSEADLALGRLDGAAFLLPNPDLFVAMYVRQEAVLSSQIEGTQSSLDDVLVFESGEGADEGPKDVAEVVNYVRAMNLGLERLTKLPLSLRLIREIHGQLLQGVRGANRTPGEFRISQNWIGPAGCSLATATFVPPPPSELHAALGNLETFLHDHSLPDLIVSGLAHAQFETIHPFLDGNGRVGRLMISFILCERKVLARPLLYLSHFLKLHRAEYYDRLMAIRVDGNWEGWLKFFLRGVAEVSRSATATARDIQTLREGHLNAIGQRVARRTAPDARRVLDYLFAHPILTVRMIERDLACSFVTANKTVQALVDIGILRETTGGKRNRRFRYDPYLALFPAEGSRT